MLGGKLGSWQETCDGLSGTEDITVVIPSMWARRDFLPRALASIEAQTIGPPQTRVVIGRTKWDGRNLGIGAVDTKWIIFFDDDDEMLPNHVQTLVSARDVSGADLIWSSAIVRHTDGRERIFDYDATPEQLMQNNYIPTGYMVRSDLARQVGGFPASVPGIPEDWGFIRNLVIAGATFHYADPPKPTWIIHLHGGNTFNDERLLVP